MTDLRLNASRVSCAMGAPLYRAGAFVQPLSDYLPQYEINTTARIAAFLAQCGHETMGLRWLREIWGPTPTQQRYEGRADLGNVKPGDGMRYLGRGLIQITGRSNYRAAGKALNLPLEEQPELLEAPAVAVQASAWYWQRHGLNPLADAGRITSISRIINTGEDGPVRANGENERSALFDKAMDALSEVDA